MLIIHMGPSRGRPIIGSIAYLSVGVRVRPVPNTKTKRRIINKIDWNVASVMCNPILIYRPKFVKVFRLITSG